MNSAEQASLQRLAEGLAQLRADDHVLVSLPEATLPLPDPLRELLQQVVTALLAGQRVNIVSHEHHLSVAEAARLLGMSPAFLSARFLDSGEIPSTKHGSERRLTLHDVLVYQRERETRLALADEISREGL